MPKGRKNVTSPTAGAGKGKGIRVSRRNSRKADEGKFSSPRRPLLMDAEGKQRGSETKSPKLQPPNLVFGCNNNSVIKHKTDKAVSMQSRLKVNNMGPECMRETGKNDLDLVADSCANQNITATPFNSIITGKDDILVTVHASDDEFMSEEEIVEPPRYLLEVERQATPNRIVSRQTDDVVEIRGTQGRLDGENIGDAQLREAQRMKDNPIFRELVGQVVAEQLRIEREHEQQRNQQQDIALPGCSNDGKHYDGALGGKRGNRSVNTQIKSPSDTTIYAPGLVRSSPIGRHAKNVVGVSQMLDNASFGDNNSQTVEGMPGNVNSNVQATINNNRLLNEQGDMINKISEFLQGMRLGADQNNASVSQELGAIGGELDSNDLGNGNGGNIQQVNQPQPAVSDEAQGRSIAERMILDAERFKAAVDRPSGKEMPNLFPTQTVDDEFFHLTCHIDSNLVPKIERGEFIELEKLLPRDPTRRMNDCGRMELASKDGAFFFVPAGEKEVTKISGIRKWEQAFRVYAAIYSKANPHRAAEIWQYVYIINLASNSFSWDNVACYDYAFRQLMARHPERSWSTIFQQMWSLSMRDPVHRNSTGGGQQFGLGQDRGNNSGNQHGRNNRDRYCWKFNKNRCNFGTRCRFEHNCYYCDGHGHGLFNCPRKQAKQRSRDHRQEKFDEKRDDKRSKGN